MCSDNIGDVRVEPGFQIEEGGGAPVPLSGLTHAVAAILSAESCRRLASQQSRGLGRYPLPVTAFTFATPLVVVGTLWRYQLSSPLPTGR